MYYLYSSDKKLLHKTFKMYDELISIIIPVYNVEIYLEECLNSIIDQTYKNLEIIIIDDGSTDNSGKICDKYAEKDKRIKIIHQKNKDLSGARNSGLKIATGKYIGFIDSDDYVELDMYESLYKLINRTKSDLVICNRYIDNSNGKRTKNKNFPHKTIITPNEALEYFYKSMYVWNKLYRKESIEDLSFVETYAQDVIYNFNVFKRIKKVACLNDCKNYYRNNPKSRLHRKTFRKNRFIYLDQGINQEILYAKENKLKQLEKNLIDARYGVILKWFSFMALEKDIDYNNINILLDLVKKDLPLFLKSKRSFIKKLFIIIACINFNVASKIYKAIFKMGLYSGER